MNVKNKTEPTAQTDLINELNIALLAYQMWEKAGYPTGKDMEFWLHAESQLHATVGSAPQLLPMYESAKASRKS